MLEIILAYITTRIKSLNLILNTEYGLCERLEKEDRAYVAKYIGGGQYKTAEDWDLSKSFMYYRLLETTNESLDENFIGGESMSQRNYNLKAVFFVPKDLLNNDNQYAIDKISSNLTNILQVDNPSEIKSDLKINRSRIYPTAVNVNQQEITQDELGIDRMLNGKFGLIAIDFTVEVRTTQSCFKYWDCSDNLSTPPVICKPVTIKEPDGTIITTVRSGGFYTVQSGTYQNSDGSFVVKIPSGTPYKADNVDVEVNAVSVGDLITNKQVDITIEDTDGATVTPDSVDVSNNVVEIVVPKGVVDCDGAKTYLQGILSDDSQFLSTDLNLNIPTDGDGQKGGSFSIEYDEDNDWLYVGTRGVLSAANILKFDMSGKNPSLIATLNPGGVTNDTIFALKKNNSNTLLVTGFESNNQIRAYDNSENLVWQWGGDTRFSSIWFSDDDAFVYVTTFDNGRIRKIDASNGNLVSTISTGAGMTNGGWQYNGIAYLPRINDKRIERFDLSTDSLLSFITPADDPVLMDASNLGSGGNILGVYIDGTDFILFTNRGTLVYYTDITFSTIDHIEVVGGAGQGTVSGQLVKKTDCPLCFERFFASATGNPFGESRGVRDIYKFR